MFHIIFSADENYIPYTAVLITSIIQNTDTKKSFEQICNAKPCFKEFGEAYENFSNLNFTNLKEQDRSEGYCFHILSNSISEQNRLKLAKLANHLNTNYPCQILVHIMQESDFRNFPKSGAAHSNLLPYYRLKISKFLDKSVPSFLYLDSDMLVLFDLRELFALDLHGKVAAVVGDCGTKRRKIKYTNAKGKQTYYFDKNYFNSGFLLVNVQEYKNKK